MTQQTCGPRSFGGAGASGKQRQAQHKPAAQPGQRGRPQGQAGHAAAGQGAPSGQPLQHQKVINRQVTRVAETGDLSRLLTTIQDYLPEMNGINLATAFHRVAKLSTAGGTSGLAAIKERPAFQELLERVVQHVLNHSLRDETTSQLASDGDEMPVHSLSIVAWCCATLQIRNKQLFAAVAEIATPRLSDFKSYEFSNLLWAFAKMSLSPCELLRSMIARLLRRREGEFTVQCLSTIAWSFTTSKRRNLVVFGSLAKELTARAGEMKPQEISNTLWAFAKIGCADPQLFQALGSAAVAELGMFKPQELSNTVWAFATAGLHHRKLFDGVAAASMRRRYEFVPQNLANILWAYAKLHDPGRSGMFLSLLQAAEQKLHQHKPLELSAVVWAASQVCPQQRTFFAAASRCCAARAQEFSFNGLANLVKALATVETDAPEALLALLQECAPKLQQFKALALCSLLHGTGRALQNPQYGRFHAEVAQFAEQIALQVVGHAHELQPGEHDDLVSVLQGWPAAGPAISELWQTLSSRGRQLPTAPSGRKHSPSVGSASTSAEGSQAEEDDTEEWPTEDLSGSEAVEDRLFERSARPPASSESKIHGAGGPRRSDGQELRASSESWVPSPPPGLGLGFDNASQESWPISSPPPMSARSSGAVSASTVPGALPFDVSCLALELPSGVLGAVQPCLLAVSAVFGAGAQKVRLRHGLIDRRVVVKRLPAQVPFLAGACPHPNILQPIAQISGGVGVTSVFGVPTFAAYPHCRHGNFGEWLAVHRASGHPVGASEAARVVLGALLGAEALMGAWGPAAVKVVQPDELFVGDDEAACIREPLPGVAGHLDSAALKWLSPEEASGAPLHGASAWPALVYRLGMMLFCAGTASFSDPFPGLSGEAVLQGLLAEAAGGPPMRPDLSAYCGPEAMRRLIASCLRFGGMQPPTRVALVAVLGAAAAPLSARPEEPMKVPLPILGLA